MGDLFPVEGKDVTVVDLRGGIHPLVPPEGVTPLAFRTILSAIHTMYLFDEQVPQFDEILTKYPNIRKSDLLASWESEALAKGLDLRGVAWNANTGLSMQQEMLIMALADPTDRRSPETVLRKMGIPGTTYRTWQKNPMFAAHLERATYSSYKEGVPLARRALIGNAVAGNQQAIELLFRITGEFDPQNRAEQDMKLVVTTVIESVLRHVQDPELRRAILSDTEAAVVGFRLNAPSRALESGNGDH